jgi:hypothetical protein
MGQHSSMRTGNGRSGWRRVAIVGVGAGFVTATVAGVGLASGTTTSTPSVYSAIAPVTVLGRSLAGDSNTDVAVAGVGSVPSNATSVQLSVTALDGTTTSSMYVYPTGATKPTSANVRWQTGETVTIPVTVAVGTSGDIHLATDAGTVTIKVAVVGYFSPIPAPTSAGYASQPSSPVLLSDETTKALASVTVPAGSYAIQGKIVGVFQSGPTDVADCFIADPNGNRVDESAVLFSTTVEDEMLSVTGIDTTSGGTISLDCYDNQSDTEAFYIHLVAVQLSSATGDVAGG